MCAGGFVLRGGSCSPCDATLCALGELFVPNMCPQSVYCIACPVLLFSLAPMMLTPSAHLTPPPVGMGRWRGRARGDSRQVRVRVRRRFLQLSQKLLKSHPNATKRASLAHLMRL